MDLLALKAKLDPKASRASKACRVKLDLLDPKDLKVKLDLLDLKVMPDPRALKATPDSLSKLLRFTPLSQP